MLAVTGLAKAGIPVGVLVAPVIPALNDHEMPAVLKAAGEAGAQWAGTEILRLPLTVAPVFQEWINTYFPDRAEKVFSRIRAMRRGNLNDSRFGVRMRGEGVLAGQIAQLFHAARRKVGLSEVGPKLSTKSFRRPAGAQLAFDL